MELKIKKHPIEVLFYFYIFLKLFLVGAMAIVSFENVGEETANVIPISSKNIIKNA